THLVEDRWALRPLLETLFQELAPGPRIFLLQLPDAEGPFPRRRLEDWGPAEAQHSGARLLGHRVAVRGGVRDEDIRAGGTVVLLAVEDELRPPARDEVELLVAQ